MRSPAKLVLGMMSGTSADGIDAALVKISGLAATGGAPPNLKIHLLNHTQQTFPPQIRKEILRVAEQNPLTPGELSQLHARLGHIYAEAALAACKKFRISPKKIDLIGNHGQTLFHQGQQTNFLGKPTASTLQLGDGSIIANITGITTVSDFRPADMARGGQGAPLVPFADYALYRHPKLGRVSLNIGGIANITVIPANAKLSDVFAFDTGPGNMLIDALVQHFTHGRRRYDKNATLARQGHLHREFLTQLLCDPYFQRKPPKSTGREYFGAAYVTKTLAQARRHKLSPNDLIHTITVFTAASIADALRRFVLSKNKISQLTVSGGGAQNPFLMCQLSALLPNVQAMPSSALNVPTDAKEALAFALLAYETFHQRPSNIPTATGARGPAILGKISYARPE
jgi:anhydro-N-acetylmuramic acid kinase